MSALYNTFITT